MFTEKEQERWALGLQMLSRVFHKVKDLTVDKR